MRNFITKLMVLLVVIVTSCSAARYVRQVDRMDEISYILSTRYPQLYEYYCEGVLSVNSIREVVLEDGSLDYRISYNFVRYYYTDYEERADMIRQLYPNIYDAYISGAVRVTAFYKYVDRSSGVICHYIKCRPAHGYYYDGYPYIYGPRIYYGPRPYIHRPRYVPRPSPMPRPNPGMRPGGNSPRPNPGMRPGGNNHRPQPNAGPGGSRPGGPSRSSSGGHRR